MARPDVTSLSNIGIDGKILGHQKALQACRKRILKTAIPTMEVLSNGEGARLIAEDGKYANCVALGPKSASEKYGLKVLDEKFEDEEAVTTFFLIAPLKHKIKIGKENRILIVFKIPHERGALIKALYPFDRMSFSLIQIHSIHSGNLNYNFAIEIEVDIGKIGELNRLRIAMEIFEGCVIEYLSFGPFEVVKMV